MLLGLAGTGDTIPILKTIRENGSNADRVAALPAKSE